MPLRSLHFGSAMIDIITLVANEDIERATFQNEGTSFLMLETGRKLPAESITTHVGGGACNTAVSLARQGWDAAILAKVGLTGDGVSARAALFVVVGVGAWVTSELSFRFFESPFLKLKSRFSV